MSEYETLSQKSLDFGTRSYVEVQRKRVTADNGGTSEFLVLTRGFYDPRGARRWTKFVTVPDDGRILAFLADALTEVGAGGTTDATEGHVYVRLTRDDARDLQKWAHGRDDGEGAPVRPLRDALDASLLQQ